MEGTRRAALTDQAQAKAENSCGIYRGLAPNGGASHAVSTHPDAAIIQAERTYCALEAEYPAVARACGGSIPDAEFDRLSVPQVAAEDLIASTPAQTWAGIAVKARRLRAAVDDGGVTHDRDTALVNAIVDAAEGMGDAPIMTGAECSVAALMRLAVQQLDEADRIDEAAVRLTSKAEKARADTKSQALVGAGLAIVDQLSHVRAESIPGAIAQIILAGNRAGRLEDFADNTEAAAKEIQRLIHSALAVLIPALGIDASAFGRDHFLNPDPFKAEAEGAPEATAQAA